LEKNIACDLEEKGLSATVRLTLSRGPRRDSGKMGSDPDHACEEQHKSGSEPRQIYRSRRFLKFGAKKRQPEERQETPRKISRSRTDMISSLPRVEPLFREKKVPKKDLPRNV